MSFLTGYLFIFIARASDVTLATIRMLMVVQGRKLQAALIGFFEVSIYVMALGKVVSNLDNPGNIFAYALGFACGNYIGITIENRIALGKQAAQVVVKEEKNDELVKHLRENGFGVTVIDAEGREGHRKILHIVFNRKDLDRLKQVIYDFEENAFITVNNINPISGGYFSPKKRK